MKIFGVEKLSDSPWLNLFQVTYRLEGRDPRRWTLATRRSIPRCASGRFETPDAVIIAAFHRRRRKLVVIRECRVPLAGVEYGFPAGLVDMGESIEHAAGRELVEETGLSVVNVLKISPPLYTSAGITDESISLVYVECDGEPSAASQGRSEQIEVLFVSAAEAACLCTDPTLKFDARAWLVIERFAATGRLVATGAPASVDC
ncbi:MAG: NUDIX hydrolase [Desulfobacterales bacterium]|jgi:ADP-ribose pyrophosphatase|nr:NUDIX hydrolase [Desulfobacterales bacterium]